MLDLKHRGVGDVVPFLSVVIWEQCSPSIFAESKYSHIAESSFTLNRSLFSCFYMIAAWLSALHLLFIHLLEPAVGRKMGESCRGSSPPGEANANLA